MDANGRDDESGRIPPRAYVRVVLLVAFLVVAIAVGTYACDRAG